MVRFRLLTEDLLKTETDLIVVSLFSDVVPLKGNAGYLDWILSGQISNLIKGKKVFGIFKETSLLSLVTKIPAGKILLLGFGKTSNLNSPKAVNLYSYLVKTLKKIDIKDFAVSFDFPDSLGMPEYGRIAHDVVECLIKGFKIAKTKKDEDYMIRLVEKDEARFSRLKGIVHEALKQSRWSSMAILEE